MAGHPFKWGRGNSYKAEVTLARDEEEAIYAARRINLRTREHNHDLNQLKRTAGLVTAKLCPMCRMLDDHCPTCGGRGVVPS